MYRTGKRVYDLVSEAVVSHQVRKGIKGRSSERNMSTFFKSSKQDATTTNDTPQEKEASKDLIRDAMSLVLFEQVENVDCDSFIHRILVDSQINLFFSSSQRYLNRPTQLINNFKYNL